MKRMNQSVKTLLAFAFSLMLFAGGYSIVRAQQTEQEAAPQAENADMQEMMERCPMMKEMMEDGERMQQMREQCPMMNEGASMQEMMQNCPMMQEMMRQMMERCPMMKGMMQDEGMQDSMMQRMRTAPRSSSEGATATLTADSVQVVEITVGEEGYDPKEIELKAGVPARLVFTRTTEGTCITQIQIPAFGIEKTELPLNEPVAVEFTPEEDGTFTFACGMDMMKGTILVKS